MKRRMTIVKLQNGNYVKDWQYSQGYFDVVETRDIFEACHVRPDNFVTFFAKKGHELLCVEYMATIIPAEKA